MKHKRYIILFICIIIIGSYLFLKDKKNNTSPASTSSETSSTGEEASKAGKAESPASNPTSSNNTASEDEVKPKKADITMIDTVPNKVGNTSGNLLNMGFAAQQGRWMYYWLANKLYRAMPDGETALKILQEKPQMSYINVVGEWIYYLSPVEGTIYKIKTDGTDNTKIVNSKIMNMSVVGDSIYYTSLEGIVRVDLEGKNKRVITDDRALNAISIVSDTIYYLRFGESTQHTEICKINTDGSNKKTISRDECQKMLVQGDWIYYINYSDNGKLYKIKTDGTSKMKLLNSTIETFNVSEDTIYYVPTFDPQNLYKASADGGKTVMMTKSNTINSSLDGHNRIAIFQINLTGDSVFCTCSTSEGFSMLRVALDGSVVKFLN